MKKSLLERDMHLPHTWEREYKLARVFSDEISEYPSAPFLAFIKKIDCTSGLTWQDAKMVREIMVRSFEQVVGRAAELDWDDVEGSVFNQVAQADLGLCNNAFDIAKRNLFVSDDIKAEAALPRSPKCIKINSIQGDYTFHSKTGKVTMWYFPYANADSVIPTILRFNLQEWKAYHSEAVLPEVMHLEDLGYWFIGQAGRVEYRGPNMQWRKLRVKLKGVK